MPKPLKRWSVNALHEGLNNPIAYYVDGQSVGRDLQLEWQDLTPVQHLLIAIAGCFSLSCSAVLVKSRLKSIGVEVVVTADKVADGENKLSNVMVSAIFGGALTDAEATSIIDQAKRLCTVTNTVSGGERIVYQSQILHNDGASNTSHYEAVQRAADPRNSAPTIRGD